MDTARLGMAIITRTGIAIITGNGNSEADSALTEILGGAEVLVIAGKRDWLMVTAECGIAAVGSADIPVGAVFGLSNALSKSASVEYGTWLKVITPGVVGRVDAAARWIAAVIRAGVSVIADQSRRSEADTVLAAVLGCAFVCVVTGAFNRLMDT